MRGEILRRRAAVACLFGSVFFAAAAAAQTSDPPDIAERIEALGRIPRPEVVAATKAIYAPLQPKADSTQVRVHRNLAYGPDPKQRLDVFVPQPLPAEPRPVLVFLHGLDFTDGDRTDAAGVFYDNILLWAARSGMVGINVDYRLAPEHPWPAAVRDIGKAVHWAIQNVAPYGGDPDRIFLMGHAAGATHVADYVAHAELQPPFGAGIKGAILLSGVYDLTKAPVTEGGKAYFGGDPSRYAERSALPALAGTELPLFVAAGEFDIPRVEEQAKLLNKAACARKNCPRFLLLPQHSQLSEVYSINTQDTRLTGAMLDFIKAH